MSKSVAVQDEDLWVVPQEWWDKAHPFRGVNNPQPHVIDPAASTTLREVLDTFRQHLEESLTLTLELGDVAVAEAAEASLADPEEHRSSLGAAAIWILVDHDMTLRRHESAFRRGARTHDEIRNIFLDGWISAHGCTFAVETALRCHDLEMRYDSERRVQALRSRNSDSDNILGMFWSLAAPLRARLASAPDPDHHAVVRRLAELRTGGSRRTLVATAYLCPEQREWVEAALPLGSVADRLHPAELLASALTTPDQLRPLSAMSRFDPDESTRNSLLTQVGVAATPLFVDTFMALSRTNSASTIREWAQLLTHFPTDDAYRALLGRVDWKPVAPALTKATARYPRRAMRLLSERVAESSDAVVEQRFRLHALAHPDLVSEYVHPLAAQLLDVGERLPDAPDSDLPTILAAPPGQRRRPVPAPMPAATPYRPLTLTWAPGEAERFRDSLPARQPPTWVTSDWEHHLAQAVSHGTLASLLVNAEPEHVRAVLRTARPAKLKRPGRAVAALLGRYQHEAVDFAVAAALANPATTAAVLMPIDGTDISVAMMRWLRSKSARHVALEWFDRHASTAVSDVVATAVSTTGKDRAVAEAALRELAEHGHDTEIFLAAETFGPAAQSAIDDILDTDPLLQLPARLPALPDWLAPALLPQIRLRDRAAALPETAVEHLLTMFMISGPGGGYPGLRMATEALDPASTTEFVTAVFEAWHLADYPSTGTWVLHALGLTGTDETVDRLVPLLTAWPANSAHPRAVAGLDVLAAIGTEKALENLDAVARQSRFAELRRAAQGRLATATSSRSG